jgi:protein subunit release factor A
VTDHRINISTYNLTGFMTGALLDDFIDELATRDESERLATQFEDTVTESSG